MISPDNEVRAIDAIVDSLDITDIGFAYSEPKETGRKPYSPVDMFKLYAYSYINGIRSSRKIERECHRNIELMWLIHELKPDFKTIADFRKNNKKPIKLAFSKFSMVCDELGLIGKELVAVDGSKFRASNSRMAYHSEKKIEKKLEHYQTVAEEYIKLLDNCDDQEQVREASFLSKSEIQTKIDKINTRLSELEQLHQQVKESGTIYETDPDSKMMKMNNKGCDICHNVQIAVDDKNHLVVAVDVTSQPIDKEQFHNMALQAKQALGTETITAIADKGYYSAEQFYKCKGDGIIPIVSKADCSHMAATKAYGKTQFKYDEENNGYLCPQGHLLKAYVPRKQNGSIHYQNYEACAQCPVKSLCSNSAIGRTIQDRPFQRYADEVDKRTNANQDMYKKRKQMVEHPFGTVKRAMGYTYFLTRGNASVKTESLLHFLAYNMKRVINMAGTTRLVGILQ
jgi:transposase